MNTFLLLTFVFLLASVSAQNCGRQAGNAPCSNGNCCSQWGYCGNTPDHCLPQNNCQYQCSGSSSGGGDGGSSDTVGSIITSSVFDQMLKYRNDPRCKANGFYTYDAFINAARSYNGFGTTGSAEDRRRELAAFFGQTSHETTGGWSSAPDGAFAWGYCFLRQQDQSDRYYGRGPIQLTHDYNYGLFGRSIGRDLINNPDLLATDPTLSFQSAIWFWMTPRDNKPSSHDVITRRWSPSAADSAAGRVSGFGVITNIINGGLECGKGRNNAGGRIELGFTEGIAACWELVLETILIATIKGVLHKMIGLVTYKKYVILCNKTISMGSLNLNLINKKNVIILRFRFN